MNEGEQIAEIRARIEKIEADTERLVKARAKPEDIYAVRKGVDALYRELQRREKYEPMRERRNEAAKAYHADRRADRKARGLCTRCGKPVEPGRTRCEACRAADAERHRKRRAEEAQKKAAPAPDPTPEPPKRINGLQRCARCGGRRAPGLLFCHACAKAVKERFEKEEAKRDQGFILERGG